MRRKDLNIRSIIPARIGRATENAPSSYYRRLMCQRLHLTRHGRRWQVETVVSMIKRRLGSAVNASSYSPQCRAFMLRAITHNVLVVLCPYIT